MEHVEEWCSLSDRSLEDEMCAMSALLSAETDRFLLVVGEYDQRQGWEAWDCHNMAMWLSWKCAISPVTAPQQVRVALTLREMPLLAVRLAAGQLRYSQVRAISRAATPETVASLVEFAECCSSAQLESIPRAFRRSCRAVEETAASRQSGRYLRCHHDDDGKLVGSFRIPAEAGAVLLTAAIEESTQFVDIKEDDSQRARDPHGAAALDALIDLVATGAERPSRPRPIPQRTPALCSM